MTPLFVHATNHLIISQVLYNPNGTDTDREAVEIYNPTNQTVNISQWFLRTKSYNKDLTFPNNAQIRAHSYFLASDSGWETHKNNEWPSADYEEPISLSNSDAGVALVDNNNNTIDSVGWGNKTNINEDLFETQPSLIVADGHALIRRKINNPFIDTNNNSNDFYEGKPNLHNSNFTESASDEIHLLFNVVKPELNITNVMLTDDFGEDNSSITPNPESNRTLTLIVKTNLDANVSATLLNKSYILTLINSTNGTFNYIGKLNISYREKPGEHVIFVNATNGNKSIIDSKGFYYESLLALKTNSNNINIGNIEPGKQKTLFGDYNINTPDKPTVKNIGNVNLDIIVNPYSNNNFNQGNIEYSFDDNLNKTYSLNETQRIKLNLKTAETMPLSIRVRVPASQSLGSYNSVMELNAISSGE